jgi:CBS domain containing-hemolysin-like protein
VSASGPEEELRLRPLRIALAGAVSLLPAAAHASFLSGDTLDAFANGLAWFILIVMPLAAIGAFLYVHVLPEVIAERRHHPQKDAIKVLCILSLFFGGMLWPFAWLWAYTRPTLHRAVYGSEKHDDYYVEMGEKARAGALTEEELDHLQIELDAMAAKGQLPPALREVRKHLDERAGMAPDARAAPHGAKVVEKT